MSAFLTTPKADAIGVMSIILALQINILVLSGARQARQFLRIKYNTIGHPIILFDETSIFGAGQEYAQQGKYYKKIPVCGLV